MRGGEGRLKDLTFFYFLTTKKTLPVNTRGKQFPYLCLVPLLEDPRQDVVVPAPFRQVLRCGRQAPGVPPAGFQAPCPVPRRRTGHSVVRPKPGGQSKFDAAWIGARKKRQNTESFITYRRLATVSPCMPFHTPSKTKFLRFHTPKKTVRGKSNKKHPFTDLRRLQQF